MAHKWIINASPVILYSRVNQLAIIEQLAPALAVPDAVAKEIRRGITKKKKNEQEHISTKDNKENEGSQHRENK